MNSKMNQSIQFEQDLIDPEVESQRLNKKMVKLRESESKILQKMSHPRFKRAPSHKQASIESKVRIVDQY